MLPTPLVLLFPLLPETFFSCCPPLLPLSASSGMYVIPLGLPGFEDPGSTFSILSCLARSSFMHQGTLFHHQTRLFLP